MRKQLIAGNWKMFKTPSESKGFLTQLKAIQMSDKVEVVVFPPFTSLQAASDVLQGSGIGWGGQTMHANASGAFTGDISAEMLVDLGCQYVLLGHSERRQYHHETDPELALRLARAVNVGITPVLCVGETLEERESGQTLAVIERQLTLGLSQCQPQAQVVIAYEPVWAIGTGKVASTEQAQGVHRFIRERLAELWGVDVSAQVRVLYGGSVKPDNAHELLSQPDIDGALVGGASLVCESFEAIVQAAMTATKA